MAESFYNFCKIPKSKSTFLTNCVVKNESTKSLFESYPVYFANLPNNEKRLQDFGNVLKLAYDINPLKIEFTYEGNDDVTAKVFLNCKEFEEMKEYEGSSMNFADGDGKSRRIFLSRNQTQKDQKVDSLIHKIQPFCIRCSCQYNLFFPSKREKFEGLVSKLQSKGKLNQLTEEDSKVYFGHCQQCHSYRSPAMNIIESGDIHPIDEFPTCSVCAKEYELNVEFLGPKNLDNFFQWKENSFKTIPEEYASYSLYSLYSSRIFRESVELLLCFKFGYCTRCAIAKSKGENFEDAILALDFITRDEFGNIKPIKQSDAIQSLMKKIPNFKEKERILNHPSKFKFLGLGLGSKSIEKWTKFCKQQESKKKKK